MQDKIFTYPFRLNFLDTSTKGKASYLIDGKRNFSGEAIKELLVIEFTPLAFSSPRKLFKRKVKVSFVFVLLLS
jgi:hypothetical protein